MCTIKIFNKTVKTNLQHDEDFVKMLYTIIVDDALCENIYLLKATFLSKAYPSHASKNGLNTVSRKLVL